MGFWVYVMLFFVLVITDDFIEFFFDFQITLRYLFLKVPIGVEFLLEGKEIILPIVGEQCHSAGRLAFEGLFLHHK